MTINQPTNIPTNKVTAVGVSGSLTLIIIYVIGLFGVDLPPEVASAITTLVAFASGYFVKERI